MFTKLAKSAALATAALLALPAAAQSNQGPPAGAMLSLDGTAIPHSYQQYSFDFIAGAASTNLTFAFRDDPSFLFLDDVSLALAGTGANLLTNGGFEAGPAGSHTPTGWSYVNQYGAGASGVVQNFGGNAHGGSDFYYDGAIQAYDAITQAVATQVGGRYTVSFWLKENSGQTTFHALSTNGDTTDSGGNGINLAVYAQDGVPPAAGAVPEPASWAMLILGMGAVGGLLRRRVRAAEARFDARIKRLAAGEAA